MKITRKMQKSAGGGYILVSTTGEDFVVTAKDNAANAKIKEFGFP
jgi:hypothetical protein